MSGVIGYMVVEPSPIPSEPPKADWDGEIHPTREQAEVEATQANTSGSEPGDTPDETWRIVAVVEVDAIADAEKRGAVKALRGFTAGFALDNDPTSRVLAGRVASDLMDRAHLIEHGEVDLDGDRIESGEVTS